MTAKPTPTQMQIDEIILSVKYSEKGGIIDREAKAKLLALLAEARVEGRDAELQYLLKEMDDNWSWQGKAVVEDRIAELTATKQKGTE